MLTVGCGKFHGFTERLKIRGFLRGLRGRPSPVLRFAPVGFSSFTYLNTYAPLNSIYAPTVRRVKFPYIPHFFKLRYIYNKHYNNNNRYKNYKTMKRTYRNDMGQAQRDKIAAANTGKTLSPETRRKISQALTDYWAKLPYKPDTTPQNNNPYGG